MNYLMITNKPERAQYSIAHGVNQVFIDMETLGKEERQKDRGAVFNNHSVLDIENICNNLKKPHEHVLVRINPVNPNTFDEIDDVLKNPIQTIMLPYFKTLDEVRKVREYIGERAQLCLLFETLDSLKIVKEIITDDLCDQIHFGLNDLSIEMGYQCIFKVLYSHDFLSAVEYTRNNKTPFGIGGVGKIGLHEIPAEMLLIKYLSLGSQFVILSRAFNSENLWEADNHLFEYELSRLNQVVHEFDINDTIKNKKNSEKLREILSTKI